MPTRKDFATKLTQRTAGVLLHISSLPNRYPIGNLGASAYDFVDALAEAKQSWWQMLPTNPIGAGNSPYSTTCSLAGEPLLISPDLLVEKKLLHEKDLKGIKLGDKKHAGRTNYKKACALIYPLLKKAYSRFDFENKDYLKFCASEKSWLDDYALFQSLSEAHKTPLWSKWPKELRLRDPAALTKARTALADDMAFHKFTQFCFFEQWQALKTYANEKGVGLIGDIPIFVSFESSDVWANQKYFWINKDGSQQFVAGVPPDFFNKDGQRWGNALYRWDVLEKEEFSWWINRFQQMMKQFDLIRIDHFIGFHRYWEIAASAKHARNGKWRIVPGDALFTQTKKVLGHLPFIAEDLGLLTAEVTALREKHHLPSMKILQFAFANDGGKSSHLPCNFDRNCVVYTGTHDNDTTVGWFRYAKKEAKKKKPSFDFKMIESYLVDQTSEVHWQMIAEAQRSVATMAIVPLQDILGLGTEARMNVPGVATGNWEWRYRAADLKAKHLDKLGRLTQSCGRGS